MTRIYDFLIEAAYLWAVTAVVVIVASAIHHIFAVGDLKDLRKRIDEQQKIREPKNSRKSKRDTLR